MERTITSSQILTINKGLQLRIATEEFANTVAVQINVETPFYLTKAEIRALIAFLQGNLNLIGDNYG